MEKTEMTGKNIMEKKIGIYAYNDSPAKPERIYTGWPQLPPLPEDFPDETTLTRLENAFPEMTGDELLRLEDHLRHNPRTLLKVCAETDAKEILRKLEPDTGTFRFTVETVTGNNNPDLLPPLYAGQRQICNPCQHFTVQDRVATCGKRWICKWGGTKPRQWDADEISVNYHSQCENIFRQFRFEAALLCYTDRFRDEAAGKADSERLFAERKRLLDRDALAAAESGCYDRCRRRCRELGMTFKEFVEQHDLLPAMLSFGAVSSLLLGNVRFLLDEGVEIPQKWRDELTQLEDGYKAPGTAAELRKLLDTGR